MDALANAKQTTARYGRQIGEMGIMDLIHELDWFWAIHYDEAGLLKIGGLNALQKIALAAAMKAYAEGLR
jgi:hypothetical protein